MVCGAAQTADGEVGLGVGSLGSMNDAIDVFPRLKARTVRFTCGAPRSPRESERRTGRGWRVCHGVTFGGMRGWFRGGWSVLRWGRWRFRRWYPGTRRSWGGHSWRGWA